jgi:hypothetical protein
VCKTPLPYSQYRQKSVFSYMGFSQGVGYSGTGSQVIHSSCPQCGEKKPLRQFVDSALGKLAVLFCFGFVALFLLDPTTLVRAVAGLPAARGISRGLGLGSIQLLTYVMAFVVLATGVVIAMPRGSHATKGQTRLLRSLVVLSLGLFMIVKYSDAPSLQSLTQRNPGSAARQRQRPPTFRPNALLTRDFEASTIWGKCILPKGTPVLDRGPFADWQRDHYREPMEHVLIEPGVCSRLRLGPNSVLPRSVLEKTLSG